jgi:hypothetical protein
MQGPVGGTSAWLDFPTAGGSGGIGSGGSGANPWLAYVGAAGNFFSDAAVGDIAYRNNTNLLFGAQSSGNSQFALRVNPTYSAGFSSAEVVGWSSTLPATGTFDIALARNSAGILEINNGTAGTYRDLIARNVQATAGTASAANNGIFLLNSNLHFAQGGSDIFSIGSFNPLGLRTQSSYLYAWSSTNAPDGTVDTALGRNAAGVVEVNSGTAGAYRDLLVRNLTLNGTCTGCVDQSATTTTGQSIGNADTYISGSGLTIPAGDMNALGATYHCILHVAKTGAGTAGGPYIVRIGTAGTTSDTASLSIATPGAGTAIVDTGTVDIWVKVTTTGASGIISGATLWTHNATNTGLWSTNTLQAIVGGLVSGAATNLTTATKIGVSYTAGASGAHTHNVLKAEYFKP